MAQRQPTVDDVLASMYLHQQKGNRMVENVIDNILRENSILKMNYEALSKEYEKVKEDHPEIFKKESSKNSEKKD